MKLKKYDSINVIPFIDVLLVLLAIVLLTSTFITRGIIPISLPNASNADNLKPDKEVIIVIQEDGQLMIEDKPATLESIESEILQKTVETPIHINTDKNTRFESFVQVLDMLKKNNYSNVSIVTKK
ncbi:TonB system transport protein ExbD [Aliarcobacter butzleri]|jgi:biopolymer transport protein ExbD|uniref:Biopolymer transport protein ExbD n=8 Tax=root TaxID=1 RepID=A8ESP5_ALIB4|nr:TonB system transport protein ExbD [Aliarcobacter butzleri]ABV66969.1 biopolymer transport protein ExbD [Aliarcobacter butzleri RM4018]AGR77002.1 TonB system transport protein ExbD [Aliarcobacter butzleri 7h1h]EFU70185.1 biopolymer transport ExbD protein [Aliarcobacter butzleri JV22]KLD97761.1 biopolymer transporter ExbD [Aliarcobacter butzleri L349]KLD99943.1 biopolymer transporter ExbD [Aliarcobacter butzleri L351]